MIGFVCPLSRPFPKNKKCFYSAKSKIPEGKLFWNNRLLDGNYLGQLRCQQVLTSVSKRQKKMLNELALHPFEVIMHRLIKISIILRRTIFSNYNSFLCWNSIVIVQPPVAMRIN